MRSAESFNADIGVALLGFNHEAVLYCQSVSDPDLREYAMDYARMLRSRAKGLESEGIRFSVDLFQPNRDLIEATLDRIYRKCFVTSRVASKLP